MKRKSLNDRTIKGAKPEAKPYEIMEADGFGLRVLPGGAKSFILTKRYPGSSNPTRRTLGHYPAMTLAQAHEKARVWRELIGRGIDPAVEERQLAEAAIAAEKAKQAATFSAALEVYCRRRLAKLRRGRTVENELRRELKAWMDKPLADITARDVKAVIQAIADRGHEAQAHQIFGYVRAFFNWVVDTGDFGIENSPCLKLKPKVLIGARVVGARVLNDAELAACWKATKAMSPQDGAFIRLLMLSAVRRTEAAEMRWREVEDGLWTIPSERMKNGGGHIVPLTPMIRELLDSLPRGRGGDFVFSNNGGLQPICAFSRIKAKLDEIMKADLEAQQKDDPKAQGLEWQDFRFHDLRRTVRTRLSKLRVSGEVAEAILAHGKPGLHKVYNLHDYLDEKAEALALWHGMLRSIVDPAPDNVVPLRPTG